MTDKLTKTEQLERIIVRHQDDLFRFAYFRTGSRTEAEDAVQEVLLRLFSSKCDLNCIRDVERYLLRAIANRCCDYHRKRRTAPISIEQAASVSVQPSAEEEELQQEYERIALLLESLPPEQAEVIRLKSSDSLTFSQIAEITDTTEATAKSRFRYGIRKLREFINH